MNAKLNIMLTLTTWFRIYFVLLNKGNFLLNNMMTSLCARSMVVKTILISVTLIADVIKF